MNNLGRALSFDLEQILVGGRIDDYGDIDDYRNIYFLIRESKVVYVGRALDVGKRSDVHKRDKEFDNISFIRVGNEIYNEVEAFYIAKFNPEYNNSLPPNSLFYTVSRLKSELRSLLNDSMEEMVRYSGYVYSTEKKTRSGYITIGSIEAIEAKLIISLIQGHLDDAVSELKSCSGGVDEN
jgi:hypothetical protein